MVHSRIYYTIGHERNGSLVVLSKIGILMEKRVARLLRAVPLYDVRSLFS
jgi:hypothetical protein